MQRVARMIAVRWGYSVSPVVATDYLGVDCRFGRRRWLLAEYTMSEASIPATIRVAPGTRVNLNDFDPAKAWGPDDRDSIRKELTENTVALDDLASRLYAESRRALLIVLQGMDTSGKDGTIRNVMRGINPLLCSVVPFKAPHEEELAHDFLWRVHARVPRRGLVGIFNRSHYEDVVVVRVRKWIDKRTCKQRYRMINEFERMLVAEGTTIIKFFLHISNDEQRRRLEARLRDPHKRWKFHPGDLADRKLWDDFQRAYSRALTECNTKHAPWYIVPSNSKQQRNLIVSRIVRQTLEQMDPQFPREIEGLDNLVVE